MRTDRNKAVVTLNQQIRSIENLPFTLNIIDRNKYDESFRIVIDSDL